MRLWHYKLLPYLPDKWLIDQWRSLVAIKRNWEINEDKFNIPLVNYITKHPIDTFHYYTYLTFNQMALRNIKTNRVLYDELMNFNPNNTKLLRVPCIYPEHNEEYMEICYFNLKEKYLRGILTREEWQKIVKFYKEDSNDRK